MLCGGAGPGRETVEVFLCGKNEPAEDEEHDVGYADFVGDYVYVREGAEDVAEETAHWVAGDFVGGVVGYGCEVGVGGAQDFVFGCALGSPTLGIECEFKEEAVEDACGGGPWRDGFPKLSGIAFISMVGRLMM